MQDSIKSMNKFAKRYLQLQFKKFYTGARKPIYVDMSKKKKKALTLLMNYTTHTTLRSMFIKMAINT